VHANQPTHITQTLFAVIVILFLSSYLLIIIRY